MSIRMRFQSSLLLSMLLLSCLRSFAAENAVAFKQSNDSVEIAVDGRPIATYYFRDTKTLRPFLAHVRAPNGLQVTRNHPPVAGVDATDHDTMHPGIWLAFGDLGDADFWRNKGHVEHVRFVEPPKTLGPHGEFTVQNRYLAGDRIVCDETCRLSVDAQPDGTSLIWDSTFSTQQEFAFGDQEEMGLGVRVATPLAVKNGGTLTNSDGARGEKEVWGKQAEWCDYSGTIDSQQVGVLIVPDPMNFGRSWYHARDYGFVAANPFGRKAFTKGEASRVVVQPEAPLRLRYAVVLHSGNVDLKNLAAETLALLNSRRSQPPAVK